ncbi:hypothetical protein EYF80_002210 [Liparis tanakae]|uniref:Uncharacterized protein n=1 Tax=Liparis tanakae TaxID=230148 RepID=A0A4Z2JCI8_9TELE|nr:hypothetical protein EYF80_002210 [Liparis tanakae]
MSQQVGNCLWEESFTEFREAVLPSLTPVLLCREVNMGHRCSWHMRPSSLKASLMSRTLRRSRELLDILLSRSRSAFCSGFRSSSSQAARRQMAGQG